MARIASKEDLQSARDLGAEIQKTLDNSSGFAEKLANLFSKIDGNAQNLANSIDKFSKKQNRANKDNLKGQMLLNKASLTRAS